MVAKTTAEVRGSRLFVVRVLTASCQTAIAESTITIFSKTWCPYCRRAKALLTEKFPDVSTKILEYVSAQP